MKFYKECSQLLEGLTNDDPFIRRSALSKPQNREFDSGDRPTISDLKEELDVVMQLYRSAVNRWEHSDIEADPKTFSSRIGPDNGAVTELEDLLETWFSKYHEGIDI